MTTKQYYTCLTTNSYGISREATLAGRECVVLPVVLMTPGKATGNHGELTYTENHLGKYPQGWDNKPVLLGHPKNEGAGTAKVLESQQVGILLNSRFENKRLKAEAWLYKDRLDLEPRIMEHVKAKTPVPVSTGLFHDVSATTNAAGAEELEVVNIVPDHLAILFDEEPACGTDKGAGLLMNAKGTPAPTTNALSNLDIQAQLQTALTTRFGIGPESSYRIWIDDVFSDPMVVVFEYRQELYTLPYSITSDLVSVGSEAPTKVIRQRMYRTESGGLVGGPSPTTNSKGNEMDRSQMVSALNGRGFTTEELQGVPDALLTKMLAQPVPTQNSGTAAPAAVPEPPAFDYNKWLETAPPEVREAHTEGINTLRAQREQLVGTITTNAAGVWTAEALAGFDLPTLRRIAATCKPAAPAAPAPTQNGLRNLMFGAGPAPTNNASGDAPAVEPLLAPDWSAK